MRRNRIMCLETLKKIGGNKSNDSEKEVKGGTGSA